MLYIILIKDDIIMIEDRDGNFSLPNFNDLQQIEKYATVLLSSEAEYVVTLTDVMYLPSNFKPTNIRFVLNHIDLSTTLRVIYYQQLNQYYIANVYCGRCGNQTNRQTRNKFVFCSTCDSEKYPHIAPCIMVRIHRGDEILMARGVNFPPNRWGLIAGFVEIGETLEDAVAREVKEEVGLEIKSIRYWGSQPWTFPSTTLMVGFTAEYAGGEIKLDPVEILEAGFFTRDTIPGMPSSRFSLASRLINEYLDSNH